MKHILIWPFLLISVSPVLAGSSGKPTGSPLKSVSNPVEDDSESPSILSLMFSIVGDILLAAGVLMVLGSGTGLVVLWVGTTLCALALIFGVVGLIRANKRGNRLSRKRSVMGIIIGTAPFALFFILLATLLLVNPFG